jgi:hypothetical protein
VGSTVPGKLANFTILSDKPLTVPSAGIKDIKVWGTMYEGRILPVQHQEASKVAMGTVANDITDRLMDLEATAHAGNPAACIADSAICKALELRASESTNTHVCTLNKAVAAAMFRGI